LWSADRPLLPAEIQERLGAGDAYTSIATILTRLQTKGLVTRSPAGRAYAYRPAIDESALTVQRIGELLEGSTDRTQVLSRFIGSLSARELKAVRKVLDSNSPPKQRPS
jgi:predicted transcriptional regulator